MLTLKKYNIIFKIPTPEFIVLYNGTSPYPEDKILKLSDAFIHTDESQSKFGHLEVTVRVANINPGFNDELKNKSETLKGYSIFVNYVREYMSKGLFPNNAISEAIKHCVREDILSEYLTTHSSEVENMIMTEFDIDIAREVWREEAYDRARKDERELWQTIVADKDTELVDKDIELAGKDTELANKNIEISNKDTEIARLRAMLDNKSGE